MKVRRSFLLLRSRTDLSAARQAALTRSTVSSPPEWPQRDSAFCSSIAAEYRLLPAPFPAALQDVAAVFLSLLERGVPSDRIVLIGDSTGGNIMLALSRWIRDEGLLKQPAGLLLLSVGEGSPEPLPILDSPLPHLYSPGPIRVRLGAPSLSARRSRFPPTLTNSVLTQPTPSPPALNSSTPVLTPKTTSQTTLSPAFTSSNPSSAFTVLTPFFVTPTSLLPPGQSPTKASPTSRPPLCSTAMPSDSRRKLTVSLRR